MKIGKNYLPYLAGIIVFTIFGFSFLFTKNSLEIMSPLQVLAYRFTTAALLLSLFRLSGILKVNLRGKNIKDLLVLALAEPVAYFMFETAGINMTSSSEAGMMIALIPVVVTILAALFLNEKPCVKQVFFILISVAGVIFIILSQGASDIGGSYLGLLALMGAVLSASVYNILSRKLSFVFKPVEITFVMMWRGAITFNVIGILSAVFNGNVQYFYAPLLIWESWIPVLYLGVLSSVAAYFMMNYMLSKLPASQTSVFTNLTTVISILAGVLIRGEEFYWFHAVGGAMILLGVWGTNYYESSRSGTVH